MRSTKAAFGLTFFCGTSFGARPCSEHHDAAEDGSCNVASTRDVLCADLDKEQDCISRAGDGQCETDPRRMWVRCASACGSCDLHSKNNIWQQRIEEIASQCKEAEPLVEELQRSLDSLPLATPEAIAKVVAASEGFRLQLWSRCPFVLHGIPGKLATLNFTSILDLASGKLPRNGEYNFMDPRVKSGAFKAFRLDYGAKQGDLFDRGAVEKNIEKSTWLISAMHTLHPAAGEVTLAFQQEFGLLATCNMYATRPGFPTAAAKHTDRMDAFLLQAAGRKKWRVWAPKVLDPVWGVHEDGQWGKGSTELVPEQMGPLLLERILRPGDILFVPRGFVHETATPKSKKRQEDTSVALTMALPTEMYNLVYEKAMLCSLGASGVCKDTNCPLGANVSIQARRDPELRRALPLGFLRRDLLEDVENRKAWIEAFVAKMKSLFARCGIDIDLTSKLESGIALVAEKLWDVVGNLASDSNFQSLLAPLNVDPGACMGPKCEARQPMPLHQTYGMYYKALNFHFNQYFDVCNAEVLKGNYMEGRKQISGWIQEL